MTVPICQSGEERCSLVGAVVTALRPNFGLAKLKGDAAFTFATAETVDGSTLLDPVRAS